MEMEVTLEQREIALEEREEEMDGTGAQLAQAVAVYHTSLLATEPEIPDEMFHGAQ